MTAPRGFPSYGGLRSFFWAAKTPKANEALPPDPQISRSSRERRNFDLRLFGVRLRYEALGAPLQEEARRRPGAHRGGDPGLTAGVDTGLTGPGLRLGLCVLLGSDHAQLLLFWLEGG